ncbi:Protein of unknown function [Nannocystis exedens]|uniref:DUF1588 domain-containing protein n=1 Tax=Nannocystis exedens TaxID=54 RepID=A0A1I2E300_9BACT|nr:DUF1588 domain-containing protein [Nannocystis exedens]PCC69240.1 putative lipoprotein [Nannocystis exedens]SFE87013.1 Protein of unknown function [Nannocystis exedens]
MSTIQRSLLLPVLVALGCPQGGDVATQGDPSTTGDAATGAATGTDVPTTSASGPGPTSSDTGATGDTGDTGDTGEPPGEPSGNALDQNALFTCDDRPALPPADLRLIDRDEWTRSVGTWSGTDLANNPLYPRAAHRYSTYSDDEALDPSVLSLYLDVVGGSGTSWTIGKWDVGRVRTVIEDPECQCFLADAAPTPECVDYFVRRYLEFGAVYRPASDEQFAALREFAQSVLAAEAGVESRPATIKRIAAAAWMTTAALYRPELGEGQPDEHGRLRLGDWELAQAIAYALTRAPAGVPSVNRTYEAGFTKGDLDGDLGDFLDAAADGTIKDPDVVATLVRAHIGGLDEERRDLLFEPHDGRWWENQGEYWMATGVRAFFREWLGYGGLADKPPKVEVAKTSGWMGTAVEFSYENTISGIYGYENTLVTQLDDMIARIVAGDQDVYRQLLTSRLFYTPATEGYQEGESSIWKSTAEMNRVYNVQGVTPQTREARWKELPENERAGVLTHPAWLGAHSLSFENDPNLVHRGKWIREELLCQNIPDLPLNVDAMLSEESREQSARQRISEQIDADPYCNGCHQMMNPLGYPFEIYNHAGFLRVEDHGGPPNGTSVLANMPAPELDGAVTSAIDLSVRLAGSKYAKRCFMRQAFRFFAGREETMHDGCTLVAMETAYDESGGSFTELLIALFNSDSFQYRVPE